MALRHVERTTHGWQVGREQCLVGRIEWDSGTNGRVPLLVIDGRPFTWEDVGRMLMTFEASPSRLGSRTQSSWSTFLSGTRTC